MKEKITKEGYGLLVELQQHLINVEGRRLQKDLNQARKFCDFYQDTSFKQLLEERLKLDQQIKDLEQVLSRAEIIDSETLAKDRLSFGSRVSLLHQESGQLESYTIGHPAEVSVRDDIISVKAPLAKQLLGKRVGDIVSLSEEGDSFKLVEIK